jgi:lipopolysaccharide assembly protein A
MSQAALIFSLILAIAVSLFAVQNSGAVVLRFGPMQTELSLVIVILVSVAAGAVLASLMGLPGWMRDRRQVRGLRRELESLRFSRQGEPKPPPPPSTPVQ